MATWCHRVVKDYERYASTLAGFHVVTFVGYMLKYATQLIKASQHLLLTQYSRYLVRCHSCRTSALAGGSSAKVVSKTCKQQHL